jgi:hypothetical protein
VSEVIALPRALLDTLAVDVRAAAWFAALGEPLTESDRSEATSYVGHLALGPIGLACAGDWPHAEAVMKSPDWSTAWWECEEATRRSLLEQAQSLYPERSLWTALTELTTEAGDLVHGKAAAAAARMGGAAAASIHVAAGAAAQAVNQLALARLAQDSASPFESKFRLFAAGRWPLGVVGSRLVLF